MSREETLELAAELVRDRYVFPAVARRISEELLQHKPTLLAADEASFLSQTNALLASRSRDSHLRLLEPREIPQESPTPVHERPLIETTRQGDIAVVSIARFPKLRDDVVNEIDRALRAAYGARGVVFDIRGNEGGDVTSVALVTSYLVPSPSRVLAEYHMRGGEIKLSSTWERLPDESPGDTRPLADVRVVIAIDRNTYSAAEEFAYNLQQMKRAIVVGERSRGGAHPTRTYSCGAYRFAIPFAETINPISRTNWEAIGVMPDIRASSDEALARAISAVAE